MRKNSLGVFQCSIKLNQSILALYRRNSLLMFSPSNLNTVLSILLWHHHSKMYLKLQLVSLSWPLPIVHFKWESGNVLLLLLFVAEFLFLLLVKQFLLIFGCFKGEKWIQRKLFKKWFAIWGEIVGEDLKLDSSSPLATHFWVLVHELGVFGLFLACAIIVNPEWLSMKSSSLLDIRKIDRSSWNKIPSKTIVIEKREFYLSHCTWQLHWNLNRYLIVRETLLWFLPSIVASDSP